mmetsp:Transcript_59819/g.142464  ORF Transcript_59819/g.142464 Transcript_59819/m.142464 type:complete len:325 (+) Transcript_59819:101-1075(+)
MPPVGNQSSALQWQQPGLPRWVQALLGLGFGTFFALLLNALWPRRGGNRRQQLRNSAEPEAHDAGVAAIQNGSSASLTRPVKSGPSAEALRFLELSTYVKKSTDEMQRATRSLLDALRLQERQYKAALTEFQRSMEQKPLQRRTAVQRVEFSDKSMSLLRDMLRPATGSCVVASPSSPSASAGPSASAKAESLGTACNSANAEKSHALENGAAALNGSAPVATGSASSSSGPAPTNGVATAHEDVNGTQQGRSAPPRPAQPWLSNVVKRQLEMPVPPQAERRQGETSARSAASEQQSNGASTAPAMIAHPAEVMARSEEPQRVG